MNPYVLDLITASPEVLVLAMGCSLVPVLRGPTAQDRVLALDCLALNGMLLMLVLMLTLMTLWLARRLVRLVAGRFPPSFWSNAWITALILFGPAIEDSATGKDVWLAAAMRCGLYLLVAGYGWLCILLLEQWWPVGRPLAEDKLGD